MSSSVSRSEVITWGLRKVSVQHADIVAALDRQKFPTKVAREMAPVNAFRRALAELARTNLVRRIDSENDGVVVFQINEIRESGQVADYPYYASLSLNKADGKVTCLPGKDGVIPDRGEDMAAAIGQRVKEEAATRRTADITRILKRLFRDEGDLFPINRNGGTYLACPQHEDFLDRLDAFVQDIVGMGLNRIRLAGSSPEASPGVQHAIMDGMKDAVKEYEQAIEALATSDRKVRKRTFEANIERLRVVRLKLDGYREVLKDHYRELVERVQVLNTRLEVAIDSMAGSDVEPEADAEPEGVEETMDLADMAAEVEELAV